MLDKGSKSNGDPRSEVSPVQVCGILTREQRGLPGAALRQSLDAERCVERYRESQRATGSWGLEGRQGAAHQLQERWKKCSRVRERVDLRVVLADAYPVEKYQQDPVRPRCLYRRLRTRSATRSI